MNELLNRIQEQLMRNPLATEIVQRKYQEQAADIQRLRNGIEH